MIEKEQMKEQLRELVKHIEGEEKFAAARDVLNRITGGAAVIFVNKGEGVVIVRTTGNVEYMIPKTDGANDQANLVKVMKALNESEKPLVKRLRHALAEELGMRGEKDLRLADEVARKATPLN